MGNRQRVKFWKDSWCGDSPLCVSFPTSFALVLVKDAWVKDVWSSSEGRGSWSPHFSRPFNDWEMVRYTGFFWALMGREFSKMWKIGCFGDRLNVGSFPLSLSTKH